MIRAAGFSLLEVLVALSILALGLLAHASNSFSGQRLTQSEARRGTAIQTLRRFLERMRSDVAFATLYDRCRTLYDLAPQTDPPAHAPARYYADFEVPAELGDVRVLVEVPRSPPANDPGGDWVLREDVTLAAHGLPFDLDGDGVIDDQPKDGDYRALPVLIHFAWTGVGDAPQRLRVSTWLKGER